MSQKFFSVIISVVFLAAACNPIKPINQSYMDGTVMLAGTSVNVDIASDDASRALGLGGRASISDTEGMWFIFDTPQPYGFWMKDMNFPIDIVWVNSGEVVDITKAAVPQPGVSDADLPVYEPSSPVDRVLELSAGWADRHGLKVGDTVEFAAK